MIDQSLLPFAIAFIVVAVLAAAVATATIVRLALEIRRPARPVVSLDAARPAVAAVGRNAA